MPGVLFDRYYRYADLTAILQGYAAEYPHLVRLESIGKSYEGRDIWLITATALETGAPEDKPALWVDGNIHASEVSPSSACLYLIERLVKGYSTDDTITRALKTRVFYICPRVSPDGAEWALADKPKIIRSSTRPYPYDEEPLDGLVYEDIDGDGRMLMMRIPDPNGAWKPHPDEPRLLIRRDPAEMGGEYYRVMFEGTIQNYDGVTVRLQPRKEGLDLNRNFPSHWRQEYDQSGAGPYPTSEPEVRAVVDFIARHPNIIGAVTFHTWSGVILRPYGTQSDDHFPAEDLWTFQRIGEKGTQLTGYPTISVFHDFKYHPKEVITGVFDDWVYDHLGAYAWTVELWSPQRQAGIENYKFIDWYREHPLENALKMLKWSDEALGGRGYVNWYPFDHPQLGRVELGGWDM
ncbi:MAG: carboxypeptidase, partial [Phototrophicales bacterium]